MPKARRSALAAPACAISLLTGGGDRPYALGITAALTARGVEVDFIGSETLDAPELRANPRVNFLNLRGAQNERASRWSKVRRILLYYGRLLRYAAASRPKIFHILWNNKIEYFDRTALMLFYRLCGKRIVFTAHNVNARERDGGDSALNRWTLRAQYRLADHIFVHTSRMKRQLLEQFAGRDEKVTVIPFGLNTTVPNTALTSAQARRHLNLRAEERVLLCFGGITSYKGIEYAVAALARLQEKNAAYRLVIAGSAKPGAMPYWNSVRQEIARLGLQESVLVHDRYVPDNETEIYFKAADLLLLPYTHIFQSGVMFLGYGYGLAAVAADVGSLKEEVIEGETGYIVPPRDANALAAAVEKHFENAHRRDPDAMRRRIRAYADERYSWDRVGEITTGVYADLLRKNTEQPI